MCGDGIVSSLNYETCDTDPAPNGNACRGDCTYCGDGNLDFDEECDDGNTDDTDYCTNNCTNAVCGDGIVQPALGEQCDDGNNSNGDGCTSDCMVEGE